MRPRAIRDLAQLNDAELFPAISEGMRLCVANSLRLWRDSSKLRVAKRPQGAAILRQFAEEEAAKFHILMDAVRCPRQPADRFSRQLVYFNQHLARGLYAECYNYVNPSSFANIRQYIDQQRQTLYLDGPNDIDWVFRNNILRQREESIYVDYVAYEDSFRSEHHWHNPDTRMMEMGLANFVPRVLKLAVTMVGIGMTRAEGLAMIADLWREAPMDDSVTWPTLLGFNVQTMKALNAGGVLRLRPVAAYQLIVGSWAFPLYPLDLGTLEVNRGALREAQGHRGWNDWD